MDTIVYQPKLSKWQVSLYSGCSSVLEILCNIADDLHSMFSREIMTLLPQIITSWQVIAVTVALVLYMFLISYVSRTYHRPRLVSKSMPKKIRIKKEKTGPTEAPDSEDSNEALGLEEA